MGVFDEVECPYCGEDIDASKLDFCESNEIDVECEFCDKEFEVVREFDPSYSAHKIEFIECDRCNETLRVGENVYTHRNEELCRACFCKAYFKELETDETVCASSN